MKALFLTLVLLTSCVASAQNVAVWTHEAAHTKAFQDGCPGGWPYVVKDMGKAPIPADLLAQGWQQMTKAQLDTVVKTLGPSKEAWNLAQEAAATTPKRDRDALIKQAKADLTTIVDSSGTLTAAQLSNSVRALARILRALVEDLGY